MSLARLAAVYNEVLVATDGSDASAVAVEQAVAVADRFEATLDCCHVVDVGTEMSASAEGTIATEIDRHPRCMSILTVR